MSPLASVNPTRLFASKLLHVYRTQVIKTGSIFPKQKEAHHLLKVNGHPCDCPISCDIRMANYSLASDNVLLALICVI